MYSEVPAYTRKRVITNRKILHKKEDDSVTYTSFKILSTSG